MWLATSIVDAASYPHEEETTIEAFTPADVTTGKIEIDAVEVEEAVWPPTEAVTEATKEPMSIEERYLPPSIGERETESTTVWDSESETEAETTPEDLPTEPETLYEETEPPEPAREVYLTEEEKQMMAQLVHAEGGNESYRVKQLIVDVVFNRVDDPVFPDTIKEVIFQQGQFAVIRNGSYHRAANELEEDDWMVVDDECYKRIDYGIVYFNDDSIGGCANGKNGWKEGHMWFAY